VQLEHRRFHIAVEQRPEASIERSSAVSINSRSAAGGGVST